MDPIITSLRRVYGRHTWAPVTVGRSGARVYRGDVVHVKVQPANGHPDPGFHLAAERTALEWLTAAGLPAPEVVEVGADDEREWLVTTTVPGRSVAEEWPADRRADVLAAFADGARALHATAVADCPLDRRLGGRIDEARRALELDLVDETDLDEQRLGIPLEELYAELCVTLPPVEDLVVCHGDYCAPNVMLDPETLRLTGFLDVGRLGVADRCTDLALGSRSVGDGALNAQYGGDRAAGAFLSRYGDITGTDPRIAFYRLLDEFC